jgi:tRNA(Ser,Leu) C12 N-acetylase TAN1
MDAAILEARRLMELIGEPAAIVRPSDVPGNLKVVPEGDAHEAQLGLTRLAGERPELFAFTSHWAVVDQWVPSDLDSIRRAVAEYQFQIGASDSWRVQVNRRGSALRRQDVIDAVAGLLPHAPVDLEDPAKEIHIEVMGRETGVGIMDRREFFRDPARGI